jgi:hypothetical protein
MQGTFQRGAKNEHSLSAIPSELLVPPKKQKVVIIQPSADEISEYEQKKQEARDSGADLSSIEQPQPKAVTKFVMQPPQKFVLNGKNYFIYESLSANIENFTSTELFIWKVPYIITNISWKDPQSVIDHTADSSNPITYVNIDVAYPENVTNDISNAILETETSSHKAENLINIAITRSQKLLDPLPHPLKCRLNVDYERVPYPAHKLKYSYLQTLLDESEKMEYDFALRMQGLLNCALNAVWTCTDFGFDGADRGQIMEKFLQNYLGRFLSQVSQKPEEIQPDSIIAEALQMHSRFSARWTKEHKRGLSPNLDACSEALVSHYCEGPLRLLVSSGLTRKEIARLLRRDPVLSPQFSLCLNFFMVKMDQDRNGRNANYKSMFNATSSNILQMKALGSFLQAHQGYMQEKLTGMGASDKRQWSPLIFDWYYVVSQLHMPSMQYTGVKRSRTRTSRSSAAAFFG